MQCDSPVAAWIDADADGFGVGEAQQVCALSEGFADRSGDCDDANPSVHPQAPSELCNGVDDDCDGVVDEALPTSTFYRDDDADGFGTTLRSIDRCDSPGPEWVSNDDDCDDTDAAVHPDAIEVCDDGTDADCDGEDCAACVELVLGFPRQSSESDFPTLGWLDLQDMALTLGDCPIVLVDLPKVFTAAELRAAGITTLVISSPVEGFYDQFRPGLIQEISDFVDQGGGVVVTFLFKADWEDATVGLSDLVGIAPEGFGISTFDAEIEIDVLDATHPLAKDLPARFAPATYDDVQNLVGLWTWTHHLLPDAEIVMASGDGKNVVVAHDDGAGRGVYISSYPDYAVVHHESFVLLYNAIYWASGF